jgi:hypothetical protein
MPLFFLVVLLSLWFVQVTIAFPIEIFSAFHFPFWLTLTLLGILLSWLIGE